MTREVLSEIGADEVPARLVLNKIDRVDAESREALAQEFPQAIQLSAHDPADVARMRDLLVAWFERDMAEAELFVPWARGALVGEVHARVRVVEERYVDDGVQFTVRGRREDVARLRGMLEG